MRLTKYCKEQLRSVTTVSLSFFYLHCLLYFLHVSFLFYMEEEVAPAVIVGRACVLHRSSLGPRVVRVCHLVATLLPLVKCLLFAIFLSSVFITGAGIYTLGRELNCPCPLFKRSLMWRHVSRARKQEKIRTLLPVVYRGFLSYFFGPRLKHVFEQSFKLLLRPPKWFNAFQVLKWFSFLLGSLAPFLHARLMLTSGRQS